METRQEQREKRRKAKRDKLPQHGKSSLVAIQQAILKRSEKEN